ncbi:MULTISPECIES: hypothetical protein [Streptomyces]|uniref:hypothetical protein n=1 Tax=Streptomyces TaxID=1883 RepID=UPI00163CF512|nr:MULTISPECIES: hypothetical protein [Streptomyces]MBC2878180.1 hypothetical protein [Streptomyces sp. TYQ1024]UBI39676.1 hypothetical protein K7I03_26555 [Streptomyces mobaraensis]UKW32256.1 hypothetical protein MCU78_26490 [Streptomyces sp. TYQ1024]
MTRTTPERPIDVEALFPELSEHRRTSTRLHPRPGLPGPSESSVGGPFLWPADEPWPVCAVGHEKNRGRRPVDVRRWRQVLDDAWRRDPQRGPSEEELTLLDRLETPVCLAELADDDPIPLLALAQLFVRDVPDLTGPDGCDLLQVFWCPFEAHGPEQAIDVTLKWRRSGEVRNPLTVMPEPAVVGLDDCVPAPCVLDPEQVLEHEYVELLPPGLMERVVAWNERQEAEAEERGQDFPLTYQHDLSVAPGWKVGGFASWHLTGPVPVVCSCGTPMRPLLTVAEHEWDGGAPTWVPLEDQDMIEAAEANAPTQVAVGSGWMYVFTCPADPTHPHHVEFQ